jgi:hypothetical protein
MLCSAAAARMRDPLSWDSGYGVPACVREGRCNIRCRVIGGFCILDLRDSSDVKGVEGGIKLPY